eukprot:CAMPEP_0118637044 /NCGR_PEP_ID=MMETSP0785-20121206/2946_1 /TAXON_ID=91992 /ORGANISM="Bolidomonas pacifica, Strain CCMP 1866" /LENGTH=528 /DNA_ID=CAMNT_0006528211 /DNA_START=94 /DNA_END=1676 /DNA_ORIENTATION=+
MPATPNSTQSLEMKIGVSNAISTSPSPSDLENQENLPLRDSTTTLGPGEVERILEEAAKSAHKLRFRLTVLLTSVATLPMVVGNVMYYLIEFNLLDPFDVGQGGYYGSCIAVFGFLMLLAVMPTDGKVIRALSFVAISSLGLVAGAGLGLVLAALLGNPSISQGGDKTPVNLCKDMDVGCKLLVAKWTALTIAFIGGSLSMIPNLRRHEGRSDLADSAFKSPARDALTRIWNNARVCIFISGWVYLISAIALSVAGDDAPHYTEEACVADVTMGAAWIVVPVFYSESRRKLIMAFLQAMNAKGEETSAATVAALLGSNDVKSSLKTAKSKFRALSMSDLRAEDFATNDGSENERDLFNLTKPTKLGACHAFVSHSWSDDGLKKYQVLSAWARDYASKHNGNVPTIWFDKACIDQDDIESNLLCLPVFTSGCKNLLILAGNSYVSRLWCIMEVFVFLRMGGSLDRIQVLPVGMSVAEAKSTFSNVDVSQSTCYKENDRQKLMAIIETGFGDFYEFNELLRHVFVQRVRG